MVAIADLNLYGNQIIIIITKVNCVKFLGVSIDDKLT